MSNNPYGYLNDSTLAALQQAQNRYNNDPSIVALRQLQREIEMTRVLPDGVYAAVAEYQRIVAPLNEEISRLNNLYEPILMASRCFEAVYNDATITKQDVLQMGNYLKADGVGTFGIIISRKGSGHSSNIAIREMWLHNHKMIVVLDDNDVEQMLLNRKNGNEPAELIRKKIEDFRLSI